MNSSGKTTRSALAARAVSRAARALAALPATSPTGGLSCASVILNSASLMASPASDQPQPLDDRKNPEHARHQQRYADGGGAHVLDLTDLLVVLHGQAVGELLDRGVEQLDHQHEGDGADQLDRAHHGRAE